MPEQEENRFMMCDLLNHCEADLEGAEPDRSVSRREKTCLSTKGSTRININNRLIKLNNVFGCLPALFHWSGTK